MLFINRRHAGKLLADKLEHLPFDKKNSIVVAIPKGGIPLAHEIAKRFNLPLDIILVKKIGAPNYPELAVGSVSEDDEIYYNTLLLAELAIDESRIEPIKNQALSELKATGEALRSGNPPLNLEGADIILVDDGIATGATMEVVIRVLKKKNVNSITIASPIASAETVERLYKEVLRVVVLSTPNPLYSVGEWYADFTQVENAEAIALLKEISAHNAAIYRSPDSDNAQL